MSPALVINSSKHRHNKSFIDKCLECVGSVIFQVLLLLNRFICHLIFGRDHVKLPKIKNSLTIESVEELAEKIRKKKITCHELVKAYIDRINQTNGFLNYMVQERFTKAIEEAEKFDKLISNGDVTEAYLKKEKPLFGIPFTVKDAINIKDMQNTSGVVDRKDVIAQSDADCIKNLRNAGAIPIALTNVPELCMWWESYNKLFGRSKNAYDNSRIVGGSSGGEGCIQSVAGSAFGVGSDIAGSIRIPSLINGVFGHKPSKFIVSIEGHFPEVIEDLPKSFQSLGPICRKASDLKILLKIMAMSKVANKLRLDEKVNIKDIKVYYQKNCTYNPLVQPVDSAIVNALENAVSHMDSVCKVKSQEVIIEKLVNSMNMWLIVMKLYDFAEYIRPNATLLVIGFEMLKSLFRTSKHCFYTIFNCFIWKFYPKTTSAKYHNAMQTRNELEKEFIELLGNDGVFLYPTSSTSAPYHYETLVKTFNVGYTAVISALGLPSTQVPLGLDEDGLPIGIQVVSSHNNDRLCLAVAEELDKAFGGWRDPANTKKNN